MFDALLLGIRDGECFTLQPPGCDKTVLLRLIAGFETPDPGTVVDGSGRHLRKRSCSQPGDR